MAETIWLSPKDAAAYTSCDERTLRRAVLQGKLPAFKINDGPRVRYRAADLDAWLASSPVQAVAS